MGFDYNGSPYKYIDNIHLVNDVYLRAIGQMHHQNRTLDTGDS